MYNLEIPAVFIVTKCMKCGNEHAPIRPCEEDTK